jgi:hypothetical protein
MSETKSVKVETKEEMAARLAHRIIVGSMTLSRKCLTQCILAYLEVESLFVPKQ